MTGRNISFPIKNADGTPFYDLVLHKATFDSVVMSLGDKITGDVYYKDNTLPVTMQEYIEYQPNDSTDVVRYVLVNPPTIVREGIASDNGDLRGMTKYSFEFYHPMYMLGNFPFTDIAVSDDEEKYLSQNKTFSWIGNCFDFIAKINKNIELTQWVVVSSGNVESIAKMRTLSEVLSFDKNTIAEALKKAYETWQVPFVVDSLKQGQYYDDGGTDYYTLGKRFVIVFGLPSNEIIAPVDDDKEYSASGKLSYNGRYYFKDVAIRMARGSGIRVVDDGSYENCVIFQANITSINETVTIQKLGEVLSQSGEYVAPTDMFVVIGCNISSATFRYRKYGTSVFTFEFGKGVGLKNNSRTPKNNKIVTRLSGYGSEDNIPYGYPQVVWMGDQDAKYTIGDSVGIKRNVTINGKTYEKAISYPIYDGIVGGRLVKLIKHPFTRTHLMPSVYSETVNRKVNPYAPDYNPDEVIIDYYDATEEEHYPNPIVQDAPSFEIHEFEKIKPQLGDAYITDAYAINNTAVETTDLSDGGYISEETFHRLIRAIYADDNLYYPAVPSLSAFDVAVIQKETRSDEKDGGAYNYEWSVVVQEDGLIKAKYVSDKYYVNKIVVVASSEEGGSDTQRAEWNDDMDGDGNYIQSYFKVKLPVLSFDLYASAAITQEMHINMRSGACIGCTFPVQVDWEDYKKNFYDSEGNFDPAIGEGHPRDGSKYPNSATEAITIILQKETDTFGTLMPNIYQQPKGGDKFVILGISLPLEYITSAEQELDSAMKEYMLENNFYYYDYPLKFDEYFLATHTNILEQIRNNTIVRFKYGDEPSMALYVKQMTVKYGESTLPTYDITLTDDVEIVLNQIGQVTDDVSRMRVQMSELQKYYGTNIDALLNDKLSRISDDIALGRITFQQGLDVIGSAFFSDELRSPNFESGLYDGRGWRIDGRGNAEFESLRIRSFLEVVELLVNRLQAQEGDTLFTDNDQIERVVKEVKVIGGKQTVTYILSLKEKYDGYFTPQMYGNIIKGIINTLAAKQSGVSDESGNNPDKQGSDDGGNKYYTSWMRVIGTMDTEKNVLGKNQIRVVMYGDTDVPANKNFEPCELMTIARWGCVDYSYELDKDDPEYERKYRQVKDSIEKRQRMFMISVSEGRVVKYTGVDSPKLKNGNYGVTIGELPEFVKSYPDVAEILSQVGEHTDWLYAQGIVVGNFVKIDKVGLPIVNYVDCGEWVDGTTARTIVINKGTENEKTISVPSVGHGIYLYDEYNEDTMQWETHDVWHDGAKWRCLQHQPVTIGGTKTYYEPRWNSPYWLFVEGDAKLSVSFLSSRGFAFNKGSVQTVIEPHVFFGNTDITDDLAASNFHWNLVMDDGSHDDTWDEQHSGVKQLTVVNDTLLNSWSSTNGANLTCTITVNNGISINTSVDGTCRLIILEGGVGFVAQYAPNNHPTASQIHNIFQTGDLYMRTRATNTATWSDWQKIVGEQGDETDFSFGISSFKTTKNASTAPSDISAWADAPMAVTEAKPFLWARVQQKEHHEGTIVIVSTSYIRLTGEDGKNAFVVDLRNQMTSIAVDENGETTKDEVFYIIVSAFYGTNDVTSECTITQYSTTNEDFELYQSTGGQLAYHIDPEIAVNDTETVTVSVVHPVYGTRLVDFTVAGIRGGKDAAIMELLPSSDVISFYRDASGVLQPDSRTLSLSIKRIVGDDVSIISIAQSGLDVKYSTVEMPATESDGQYWPSTPLVIQYNTSISNIYIAAFDPQDRKLIDMETVPVVKDGLNGEDSIRIDITNESDAIACDSEGKVRYNKTITTTARIFKGSTPVTENVTANDVTINGVTATPTMTSGAATYSWTFPKGTQMTAASYNVTITLRYRAFNYNASFVLTRIDSVATYQLLPSVNSLSFSFVNGAYTPSSLSVYCGYQKIDANSTVSYAGNIIENISKQNGAPYNIFHRYHKNDGTKTAWTWAKDDTNYTVTIPSSTEYTAIEYILCDANSTTQIAEGNIIDMETIPINKDGEGGVSYTIESTVGSVTIASGETTGSINTTLSFYQKKGDGDRVAYQCFSTIFKKKGATYTKIRQNAKASAVTYSNNSLNYSEADAIVVCIYDAANEAHSGYLAELEIPIRKNGDNGIAGYSTATVYLYKRSATPLSSTGIVGNATYEFATKTLTIASGGSLNGWSQTIPSDSVDTIYVTAATAFSNEGTDTIGASEWATPAQMAESGGQGEHGINTASVFLFIRYNGTPPKPTKTLTYTFSSGLLSGNLSGWSQTIPDANGNPCYAIQATAISTESVDYIESSEWSEQRKLVEDSVSYEIQSTLESIKIPSDAGTVFTTISATFYRKVGSQPKASTAMFYGVYTKNDSGYTLVSSGYNSTCSFAQNVTLSVKSVVIYTFTSEYNGTEPESVAYNAKKEIPVISDGNSAPYLQLSRQSILYRANSNGYSSSSQQFQVSLYLKVDGNNCTIASVSDITVSTLSNVTVTKGNTSSLTVTVANNKIIRGVLSVTATGTYNGKTYTATNSITIEPNYQGLQGENGRTGRFYYYAQEWSNDSSVSYEVSDIQAPYFSYNNNYWLFDPETNGVYTMAQMGTPSSSNVNWKIMVSDFRYLITEAIFGSYAHFGAAIISNDWLISTHGTIDGTDVSGASNYVKFDPSYIESSTKVYLTDEPVTNEEMVINDIYLYAGVTYTFAMSGHIDSGTGYLRTRLYQDGVAGYKFAEDVDSATSKTATYTPTTSASHHVIVASTNSSTTGTLSLSISSSGHYVPNLAIDLKTGKVYMNNAYVRGDVAAKRLYAEDEKYVTEITAGVTKWTSKEFPLASILIGADGKGMFFKMTDSSGRLIWDFSTDGNGKIDSGGGDYTPLYYKKMSGSMPSKSEFRKITRQDCTLYLQYNGAWVTNGSGNKVWYPSDEGNKNGLTYSSLPQGEPSDNLIENGYYAKENNGVFPMNTDGKYELTLYRYVGGKLSEVTVFPFDTL